jgi:hypothetical protein
MIARLMGVNFQGAIASNTNFNHCPIAGATFSSAAMENAILSYSDAIGFVPGWRYSKPLVCCISLSSNRVRRRREP